MPKLCERSGGFAHDLPSEATIGRSSACEVQLQSSGVSSRHALVRWSSGGWEVRDLGSRNGTWVDDRKLEAGESAVLTSSGVLRVADVELVLDGAGAPDAWAEGPEGQHVFSSGGVLSLPPGEEAVAQVYIDATLGWVVDQGGEVRPAGDVLMVGDQRWRLSLPESALSTMALDAPAIGAVHLHFQVSADEEWAGLTVRHKDKEIALPPRVHHYLLLTLARRRLEDSAKGVEADAQGWTSQEKLARALRIPSAQVSLQVFRARRQLAEVGVLNSGATVERRSRTGQLRLGTAEVTIQTMSG